MAVKYVLFNPIQYSMWYFLAAMGGALNAPPPMEMAPEYPRLMKIGTQVPQGIPRVFPKLFFQKPCWKKSEAKIFCSLL